MYAGEDKRAHTRKYEAINDICKRRRNINLSGGILKCKGGGVCVIPLAGMCRILPPIPAKIKQYNTSGRGLTFPLHVFLKLFIYKEVG